MSIHLFICDKSKLLAFANIFCFSFLVLGFVLGAVGCSMPHTLEDADLYRSMREYDTAIKLYKEHVEYRLGQERPDWENPYFYYLTIGDMYLEKGDVHQALLAYRTAHNNGVEIDYISHSYRKAAEWLANQDRFDEAKALLNKHQELDPILFHAALDRISRVQVKKLQDEWAEQQPSRE
jgi:tetratricopeptide (TPR) repeat protein